MQVQSTYKYARISAFKARELTRAIQGLPVGHALDIVALSPKKAAVLVAKTLKSAVANAENNNSLRVESLVVKEAVVGEGPTLKRFRPKARGSAGSIRKRTSHIKITLTDEIEIKQRTKKAASDRKPKAAARKPAFKKAASQPAEEKNATAAAEATVSPETKE